MSFEDLIPYGKQDINRDDVLAVSKALKSDYLTTGPLVEEFEKSFSKFTGSDFTISCTNGTSALHLACIAIGIKKRDWVIVPTTTFLATANAVRFCGADVLFCDVDEDTGLITPDTLEMTIAHAKKNNLSIKAVISVHLTGKPVDLAGLKMICNREKLILISDSCHALGGIYKNFPIGCCKYEDLNTFSFHPVKAITSGEGGAVTTNNEELAEKMRLMRSHNMKRTTASNHWYTYEMEYPGFNYRMSDIQCALALSQLKKVEKFVRKRERLVHLYNSKFNKISSFLQTPVYPNKEIVSRVGWHLYAVLIDFDKLKVTKSTFMNKLVEKKIRTQVHYIPVHTQPYYRKRYGSRKLPGAKNYFKKTLSLPLFTKMSVADVDYVVEQISDLIQ